MLSTLLLNYLRHFEHPFVAEWDKNPQTFRPAGKSQAMHRSAHLTVRSIMPVSVRIFSGIPDKNCFSSM